MCASSQRLSGSRRVSGGGGGSGGGWRRRSGVAALGGAAELRRPAIGTPKHTFFPPQTSRRRLAATRRPRSGRTRENVILLYSLAHALLFFANAATLTVQRRTLGGRNSRHAENVQNVIENKRQYLFGSNNTFFKLSSDRTNRLLTIFIIFLKCSYFQIYAATSLLQRFLGYIFQL